MLQRDYAFRINKIQQLLGGMKDRAEEMRLWGYPDEFTAGLAELYAEINRLQDLRNATKTVGKTASAKQRRLLREAEQKATMVRQTIRARLPKEDWNRFGFYEGETAGHKGEKTGCGA